MLLFALYLCLHARSGTAPLVKYLLVLFISALLSQSSVLVLKPCLLLFLLYYIVCGIVVEVGRASFKSIHSLKLDCVNFTIVVSKISRIECLKIVFSNSLLRLCKSSLFRVRVAVTVTRGLGDVICDSRYIIYRASICGY